jgi:N-carbamoyl-L-amino-acid hydrolase
VGRAEIFPNSRNVIPRKTVFCVEFRHPAIHVLDGLEAGLGKIINEVAAKTGLSYSISKILNMDPVTFSPDSVNTVRKAAELHGLSSREMLSGAGHDACHLLKKAPVSMIFIPCVGGISHAPEENINQAWAVAGANVLLSSILEKANE